MSSEELQNIIEQATRERLHVAQVQGIPSPQVEITHTPESDSVVEEPTPAPAIQEAQNLEEDAINEITSQWIEASAQGLDAQENTEMERAYEENGIIPDSEYATLPEPETVSTESFAQEDHETHAHGESLRQWEEVTAQAEPEEEQEPDPREATIPLELDTAHQRASTSRFNGAEWFDIVQNIEITLAGIGGIGSWTALLLSRVHPYRLFLYDPDIVETVNLSGQLYSTEQINRNKVAAVADTINKYSDYFNLHTFSSRFTLSSPASKIMISGFDNMEARKEYFTSWKNYIAAREDREECLYIDARMSAEDIQILCMTGKDDVYMKEYEEKWLFSDEEADATTCSYKQTSYCAAIIGGLITNLVVNFCTNLGVPLIDRTLPFLTSYNASTMFLNTKN